MTDDDTPTDETPRADARPADAPDAADPDAIKKVRRRKARAEDEARAFWGRVLGDPVGRRELWGILEALKWRETPFQVGPNGFPQPEATWFQAGQREAGLRLYHKLVHHTREGVALMLDEHDPRFVDLKKAPTAR